MESHKITLSIKHLLADIVYLRTDEEQLPRIVTALCMRGDNYVTYELSQGTDTSWHVEEELAVESTDYYKTRAIINGST